MVRPWRLAAAGAAFTRSPSYVNKSCERLATKAVAARSGRMARILTNCPETGDLVPTGHRTADIDLSGLTEPRSFRCPRCQKVHSWTRDTAIIEPMPDRGFRAA